MINDSEKKSGGYVPPVIMVIDICPEGVLCASAELEVWTEEELE